MSIQKPVVKVINAKSSKKMECPFCSSHDYTRHDHENDGEIWVPCTCNKCNKPFDEIYKFIKTEGIDPDNE